MIRFSDLPLGRWSSHRWYEPTTPFSPPSGPAIGSFSDLHLKSNFLAKRPVAASGAADNLADFRALWTRAMRGFLAHADAGDVLIFAPELLSGTHDYAHHFLDERGKLLEETDRYQSGPRE